VNTRFSNGGFESFALGLGGVASGKESILASMRLVFGFGPGESTGFVTAHGIPFPVVSLRSTIVYRQSSFCPPVRKQMTKKCDCDCFEN
jgi:hypothetical protein